MIIRMHRQELDTSYYERFNMGNIGKIITIAPHTLRSFKERLRLSDKTADIKMSLIYNAVDSDKFAIKKQDDAKFNLGMVGTPKIKALIGHRIFESLVTGKYIFI